MPVGVVDLLEMVEIQHQHRGLQVLAIGTMQFALRGLDKTAPIWQAGQGVCCRGAYQLVVRPLFRHEYKAE